MSTFTVDSSKDEGYQAMNTASGSRINTALRDTAASISPFTKELLDDIGAATIDDMLSYGANIETDTNDADFGFSPDIANGTTSDTGFRVRGMAMTTAMDGVATSYNMDTYNIDRAEISSGPNSILFGMGQPGGMVTLTSQNANLQRNTTRITNIIGTWTNLGNAWNYYRATLNYNLVLMPRVLALRVMGVYQDGNNNSWRHWLASHDRRLNPALTFKPFKNTTIKLAYETGKTKNAIAYPWNASDHVTGWLDEGARLGLPPLSGPIQYTFNAAVLPGTSKINSNGANPDYVFVDNDRTMWDYRQSLQTKNRYLNFNGNDTNQVRLPASMSSYSYSTLGPGGWRQQKFDRYQLVIEQRIGDLNLELGYYHNKNQGIAHAPTGFDTAIYADPNAYVSVPEWLPGGASATANPRVGQLYMEDIWEERSNINRNDAFRLTAEYSLNLKKYGRHRFIAMLEHSDSEVYTDRLNEILVDENQRAIATPDTPAVATVANNNNAVSRRHYITPGDFSTYYDSDWTVPITPFDINGHTYHAQYVSRASNANHALRSIDSVTLTDQSYWFNDNLVTIAGLRLDDTFIRREQEAQITDPADPRLLDHSKVWHERVFTGRWNKGRHRRPVTYSYGAVWHVNGRLSLFYNTSTNRSADDPNGKPILPDGQDAPVSVGSTQDYGVMFDLLGNNKFSLRLTHFDTRQVNQLIATSNVNLNGSAAILGNIYGALHASGLMLDENAPNYGSGLADAYSRGYEAELTGRLSKAFTMRFTFSYTDRARENVFKEVFAYYNSKIPVWLALADPARNGGKDIPYVDAGSPTTLYQYLLDQLYNVGATSDSVAGSSIRDDLSTMLLQQSGGMASRPLKCNLTVRYTFQDGWLKGFAIAPSIRYAAPNRMPDPNRIALTNAPVLPEDHPTTLQLDPDTFTDYATMIRGTSLTYWDLMMNYRCKILGGRTNLTLQLNIKNLFNANQVSAGQYRSTNGMVFLRRTYMGDPRSIRLTATFDF